MKTVEYKVKAGDTLSEIAKTYGVNIWDIAEASGIRNPNLIYPGQILMIPVEETEPQGVSYADIGRAFCAALEKLELLDEIKQLSGLLE